MLTGTRNTTGVITIFRQGCGQCAPVGGDALAECREPLLGMELLLGNRIAIEVREGGAVVVAPLP